MNNSHLKVRRKFFITFHFCLDNEDGGYIFDNIDASSIFHINQRTSGKNATFSGIIDIFAVILVFAVSYLAVRTVFRKNL